MPSSVHRTARISHPILRLSVLSDDGIRHGSQTVFCRLRRETVGVELCASCSRCDAIRQGVSPAVDCTVPRLPELMRLDREGRHTEVATVLRGVTTVTDSGASISNVIDVLHREGRLSIAVVDGKERLVGIAHEAALARPSRWAAPVAPAADANAPISTRMSSAFTIPESIPVRAALHLLASSHLREATVVTPEGRPIGMFRDVEGLVWIARARTERLDDVVLSDRFDCGDAFEQEDARDARSGARR